MFISSRTPSDPSAEESFYRLSRQNSTIILDNRAAIQQNGLPAGRLSVKWRALPKLPNGERAVIGIEKLREYSLNPLHSRGRHKARVFWAALALTQAGAEMAPRTTVAGGT
jgi:hypothetical protein